MTKKKSPPVKPSEEGFQPNAVTAQSITSIESDTPFFDDDPSEEDVPPLNTKAEVQDGQLVVTDPPPDPDPSTGSGQALAQIIADDQLASATLDDALITLDINPADVFASRVNLKTGQAESPFRVTIITTDARKLIYPPND